MSSPPSARPSSTSGPSGSGQTVKAANQLIVAVNIEVLAEAIAFLEAYGVDTDAALKVLGGGLAGSKVLDQKGQKMLDRNFDPGFRLALHHKDLGIVTSAAREANVAVPLGAVVAQLVAATVNQGDGGLDHSGPLQAGPAAQRPEVSGAAAPSRGTSTRTHRPASGFTTAARAPANKSAPRRFAGPPFSTPKNRLSRSTP